MPASPFALDSLRAAILDQYPELAGSRFSMLSAGWDSVAVDVDDRLIFKFPRHARGESALRREVAILRVVAPVVHLPVPRLVLHEGAVVFSRHDKLPGEHLLAAHYDALPEGSRQALGEVLGQFYAELHTIDPVDAAAAGALPTERWLDAGDIARLAWPVLPDPLKPFAETILARWAALPPDPLGEVYGFFDGHGWNMAFDHASGQLRGVYDFADSGIGPLHQEFIYSNLVSPDLTARIIASYEGFTGRSIDRARVDLLTGTHRLWEVAAEAHLPDHLPALLEGVARWASWLSTGSRAGHRSP